MATPPRAPDIVTAVPSLLLIPAGPGRRRRRHLTCFHPLCNLHPSRRGRSQGEEAPRGSPGSRGEKRPPRPARRALSLFLLPPLAGGAGESRPGKLVQSFAAETGGGGDPAGAPVTRRPIRPPPPRLCPPKPGSQACAAARGAPISLGPAKGDRPRTGSSSAEEGGEGGGTPAPAPPLRLHVGSRPACLPPTPRWPPTGLGSPSCVAPSPVATASRAASPGRLAAPQPGPPDGPGHGTHSGSRLLSSPCWRSPEALPGKLRGTFPAAIWGRGCQSPAATSGEPGPFLSLPPREGPAQATSRSSHGAARSAS